MRTYSPKAGDVVRKWHVIDAQDVVLGRLATHAAVLLRGKHKATFAPHMDMGDFVIIINAEKIALSGNKALTKFAHHHSGFPGGLTSTVYGELIEKHPTRAVEKASRECFLRTVLAHRLHQSSRFTQVQSIHMLHRHQHHMYSLKFHRSLSKG